MESLNAAASEQKGDAPMVRAQHAAFGALRWCPDLRKTPYVPGYLDKAYLINLNPVTDRH